jgi:hypothetical protein
MSPCACVVGYLITGQAHQLHDPVHLLVRR